MRGDKQEIKWKYLCYVFFLQIVNDTRKHRVYCIDLLHRFRNAKHRSNVQCKKQIVYIRPQFRNNIGTTKHSFLNHSDV